MAVSPLKTWSPGEILTASDLNNEFLNVLNNGQALGFPRTSNARFDGFTLGLDADNNTTLRASTDDQIDIAIGGTDTVKITATDFTFLGESILTAGSNEFRRLQATLFAVETVRKQASEIPGIPFLAQVIR